PAERSGVAALIRNEQRSGRFRGRGDAARAASVGRVPAHPRSSPGRRGRFSGDVPHPGSAGWLDAMAGERRRLAVYPGSSPGCAREEAHRTTPSLRARGQPDAASGIVPGRSGGDHGRGITTITGEVPRSVTAALPGGRDGGGGGAAVGPEPWGVLQPPK